MVVIDLSTFTVPVGKPMATIVIGRGAEWETQPTLMPEVEAIELAAECRKRGLTAKVEAA